MPFMTTQTPDVQQLLMLIRQLEMRVAQLESALNKSGNSVQLKNGSTSITLTPQGVKIEANDISLRASGELKLKGSRVTPN